MTEIEEALEWADRLAEHGVGKIVQSTPLIELIGVLAREYRKEKERADDAEYREAMLERQAVIFRKYTRSLDEALNSGDGTYKS